MGEEIGLVEELFAAALAIELLPLGQSDVGLGVFEQIFPLLEFLLTNAAPVLYKK